MASKKSGGTGCLEFIVIGLFLLFTGLKLGEVGVVATWSWWWVTSPLWIYAGVVVALILVVFGALVIAKMVGD